MRKKIIASDFDGTLCRNGVITEEDIRAIERFRAAGGLFGIVTGRNILSGYGQFTERGVTELDFVIGLNGGMIADADGVLLRSFSVPADTPVPALGGKPVLRAIFDDLCTGDDCHIGVCSTDHQRWFHPLFPEGNGHCVPWSELSLFSSVCMVNTWRATEADAVALIEKIRERYEGILNPLRNSNCIDIPVFGVDKGMGCAVYASLAGVDERDIWCAGDQLNDAAMLSRFNGCAMASGAQGAKDLAKHVVSSIAEVVSLAMQD